jgi:hypothetical protein
MRWHQGQARGQYSACRGSRQHLRADGYTTGTLPFYYGRFREAFITEANEFTARCLDDTEPPMKVEGAASMVRIGAAWQESHQGNSTSPTGATNLMDRSEQN